MTIIKFRGIHDDAVIVVLDNVTCFVSHGSKQTRVCLVDEDYITIDHTLADVERRINEYGLGVVDFTKAW